MRDFMRDAREKEGISLRALGEKVGASHCFLSQIETGKRNPSIKLAKKLANALKVKWVLFFENEQAA